MVSWDWAWSAVAAKNQTAMEQNTAKKLRDGKVASGKNDESNTRVQRSQLRRSALYRQKIRRKMKMADWRPPFVISPANYRTEAGLKSGTYTNLSGRRLWRRR